MKISVIIPAYNAGQFINETVSSVVNQSFQDWELIIVNDGSTDNTAEEIEKLDDSRIQILHIDNGGVSNARNMGYEQSSGEYLAFLDADDIWNTDNLERKVELFKDGDFGLVHSNCEVVDENGIPTGEVKRGKSGFILEDLLLWNGTCIPAPSSILVKREVIEKVGAFETALSTAADQEFFFRVAEKFNVGHVDDVTWKYRIHQNNMHQNISRMEKDHLLAYRMAKKNYLFKSTTFRLRCFSNLYLILAGSWWVDGNKSYRTFLFMLRSVLAYPPNLLQLLKKMR